MLPLTVPTTYTKTNTYLKVESIDFTQKSLFTSHMEHLMYWLGLHNRKPALQTQKMRLVAIWEMSESVLANKRD